MKKNYDNKSTSFACSPNIADSEYNVRRKASEILFRNQENEQLHNPYAEEQLLLDSIANGDIDTLETFWTHNYGNSYGTLAQDPLRNLKNLGIVVVALTSRAAIRGGIQPEVAFSICDSYILELENCVERSRIAPLIHSAELHFATIVKEFKAQEQDDSVRIAAHIEKCKDYIFSHMHGKLTVQEVADALYLNSNYLSKIFKKQEGQTLLQYILEAKLKMARNMLIYSPYSYSAIANYLGFSSQSHLGTHFKRMTGLTLSEYRMKYQLPEFIESDS